MELTSFMIVSQSCCHCWLYKKHAYRTPVFKQAILGEFAANLATGQDEDDAPQKRPMEFGVSVCILDHLTQIECQSINHLLQCPVV